MTSNTTHAYKVLQVTAIDLTVKALLLPLIDRLREEGYEVHVTCSEGQHARRLIAAGYKIHTIPIARRISPLNNLRSLVLLYRLIRREKYDIVHVHTPVAAVVGRVAAWLARVPIVIYTAHGFYFHDRMPVYKRRPLVWLEKLLARITHVIFTQSNEDADTAVREGIGSKNKVVWIGNGVDVAKFQNENVPTRAKFGLSENDHVVGFVGRMVREKGIVELLKAVESVSRAIPTVKLMVVGDTLESDRDRKAKELVRLLIYRDGLASRTVFTGFVEDIPGVMAAMDVLALPSYREGMPRVIIEAMASAKPIVATNIRGCREEVVHGVTGFLVPPQNSAALAKALLNVLSDRVLATQMGLNGRERAVEHFDEHRVLGRQIEAYRRLTSLRLDGKNGNNN